MQNKKYTIGIVGLSLPVTEDRKEKIQNAISYLKNEGHTVILGKTAFATLGFKTATIEERVADVEAMFKNPEVTMIMNINGGYNSNEILEFLDYDLIKKNSKYFIGYSDITALNLALIDTAHIPTINGPMLGSFEEDPTCFNRLFEQLDQEEYSFTNWEKTWSGRTKEYIPSGEIKCLPYKDKSASGFAVSGNQSTFNLLLGTPYMPNLKGAVLFLEYDIVEIRGLPTLERFLWQTRQCGIFKDISALVLGKLEPVVEREQEQYKTTLESILVEATQGYNFPVVYNTQFGHIHPSWIIENGIKITIQDSKITAHRKKE